MHMSADAERFSRPTRIWICIATLVVLSHGIVVVACGDDDDDGPVVVCDYGQGVLQSGELRTPIQSCIIGGMDARTCVRKNEQREIEWVCACRDETACKVTKAFFDRIHEAAGSM